jgi:hypothetical protein
MTKTQLATLADTLTDDQLAAAVRLLIDADPELAGRIIDFAITACPVPGAPADDPPSDIWTITKRHGEEMARVRGRDNTEATAAARQIAAVKVYEAAHGGFGMRRLRRSEAGPGADDEDV